MNRALRSWVFAMGTVACAGCAVDSVPRGDKAEEPFELRLSASGKADGTDGMLSAEDAARLTAAFDRVIAEGERTVSTIEREIARLETDNAAKAAEIDRLVDQMNARRRELEEQHRRNLVLCVFFPDPSICALAVVIDNDSRMREYQRQRDAAVAEQTRIRGEIASYESRRDALRSQLADVRAAKDRLIALFRDGIDTTVPDALSPHPEAATAYSRAITLEQIADATHDEIAILVEIRNAAAELSAVLDAALGTIRALATSVDELVADAEDQFQDLLEGLLAGDADAVARDFLEDAVAGRTRMMLAELDWPVRTFVEHLLDNRAGGEIDVDALRDELLAALLAEADLREVTLSSELELTIVDNTDAVSSLIVEESFGVTSLEVSVDIEHTYRGDLVVWLESPAGDEITLHDRTGGSADDLRETWIYEPDSAIEARGAWHLHVGDRAAADEGRLLGFRLTLRE